MKIATFLIPIIIGIMMIAVVHEGIFKTEDKLLSLQYKGREGITSFTTNSKIVGGRVFGSDLLWIKQVLDVGEMGFNQNLIKENSEAITNLDPYFIANYYFSGPVVAMVGPAEKRRPDIGIEILKRGMDYNPDDKYLKNYLAGVMAFTKGDIESLLLIFEDIVKEHRDDTLTNVVAFLYEEKYKKGKEHKFLEKSLFYYLKLLDSKDEVYRTRAEKKMKEYGLLE